MLDHLARCLGRSFAIGTLTFAILGLAVPVMAAPTSVRAVPDTSYQTNGRVWAVVTVGHTVYLGGEFTAVRPAGAPRGTQEVTRMGLAAVSADTGALLPWNPSVNNPVNALAASPDGRTIYVGGLFDRIGQAVRHNAGAVRASTGAVTSFRADTNRRVLDITTHGSRVYLGGEFSTVNGQHRAHVAALRSRGGLLTSWKPRITGTVRTIAVAPGGSSVFLGGHFSHVNSGTSHNLAKLSTRRGHLLRWRRHPAYPVWQIIPTRHRVYVGGDGVGGHVAAYSGKGALRWVKQTDGGVQAIALFHGLLYVGGHFENLCEGISPRSGPAFNCPKIKAPRSKLLALSLHRGRLSPWNPASNSPLGVFALTSSRHRLRAGGEFTLIGQNPQQGYATFRLP